MNKGRHNTTPSASQLGFTLVEVIFVVVILGIVAAIGSSFVVSAVDSYRIADLRNKLVQRGRLTIEQMARELRMAVPNSVRISNTNRCVEFLPILAATRYKNAIPTAENSAPGKSVMNTMSYLMGTGVPKHVVIAAYFPEEIYSNADPAAQAAIGALGSEPYSQITLSGAHRFLRDSPTNRVYIAADPVRFCVLGGLLQRISAYGFDTSSLGEVLPAGTVDLMAHNVAADGLAFALAPGSEERNTSVLIRLLFSEGSTAIDLHHQVLLRNVP